MTWRRRAAWPILAGALLVLATASAQETPPPGDALTSQEPVAEVSAAPEPSRPPAQPDPTLDAIARELDALEGGETAATAPDAAPLVNPRDSLTGAFLRTVVVLLIMVAALMLVAGMLGRSRKGRPGGLFTRLSKRSPLLAGSQYATLLAQFGLAPGISLYFLRTGGKVLLIGASGDRLTLLGTFDEAEFEGAGQEKPENSEKTIDFRSVLEESARRMDERAVDGDALDIQSIQSEIQQLQNRLRDVSRDANA